MTQAAELVEFLGHRFTERAQALEVFSTHEQHTGSGQFGESGLQWVEGFGSVLAALGLSVQQLQRELEARRRILADIRDNYLNGIVATDGFAGRVLQALAEPYSAHPNYRKEWETE